MITVISRPQAHKLSDLGPTGALTNSGGEAFVTTDFAHGLVDDDWIYMQSNFESYSGFFQVTDTTYNTFKLLKRGSPITFKQAAAVSYQVSVYDHGFVPVHNPIVYELESDISPVNTVAEAYTPTTVVSQEDEEGYTRLHLSVGIDPEELEFIQIDGLGVYQITEVINPWDIVINLAYDASNSFGPIVKYYNNYVININVWAGYDSLHPWQSVKPYEVAAQLQLTPDDNNRVKFSINDILRGYLTLRNNLLLDTLPNNTDFTVGYFIEYWESYDIGGAEITTFNGTATQDDFEGMALQAAMPFKTLGMSDYVNQDTYLAKWLVLQSRPSAAVGRFFDMSFILKESVDTAGFTPDLLPPLTDWGSLLIDPNSSWVVGVNPVLTLNAGHGVSYSDIYGPGGLVTYEEGQTYKYHLKIEADSAGTDNVEFRMVLLDSLNNVLDFLALTAPSVSTPTELEDTYEFVAPVGMTKFGLASFYASASGGTVTILEMDDLSETIIASTGGFKVNVNKMLNGEVIDTEILSFDGTGKGIMRVPLTIESGYDEYCVKAYTEASGGSPESEEEVTFPDFTLWANNGTGEDWVTGAIPEIDLAEPIDLSKNLRSPTYAFILGRNYRVEVGFTSDVTGGTSTGLNNYIAVRAIDNANAPIFEESMSIGNGDVTDVVSLEFLASSSTQRLNIQVQRDGNGAYESTTTITSLQVFLITDAVPGIAGGDVTETICIDIIDECSGTFLDQLRLLESTSFRLLE